MNQPRSKTALVFGGGVAGLYSAVLLDELGYKVTLLERKPILGGRTYSFIDKKTGVVVDNGQHLMIGAYHHTLQFLEKIGAKSRVHVCDPTSVPLFNSQQHEHRFVLTPGKSPWPLIKATMGFGGFSLLDKWRFSALARELFAIKAGKLAMPVNETVTAWLCRLGQSEKIRKEFWNVLTLATLNDHPNETTADGLVQVLLGSYFGDSHDGLLIFPKVGLSQLFADPVKRYLEMRRQEILSGVGVEQIKIMDQKVQLVNCSDGQSRRADLYVSALPFRSLLQVLPQAFVIDHPTFKQIMSWSSSPIISINLFYDRPIMKQSFCGASATDIHWFFTRDHVEQNPRGSGYHVMGVVSGAYDWLTLSRDQIVARACADLEAIFPHTAHIKPVHVLVNKEREATLSSRVGVNQSRPEARLLSNFLISGDWTKTDLPATIESAAKSAANVIAEIERNGIF